MNRVMPMMKRELQSYFATPVAYVFIVIFLFLCALFTFQIGRLIQTNQASLDPFFVWHPWLYLLLAPAISMRLWAEERKSGTIELLLTLPVSLTESVVAKFLAAWIFVGIALALTFPIVVTVAYLGDPDFGVVLSGYFGSFIMAGAFLAIGSCMSALTKDQAVSFVLTLVVSLIFVLSGFDVVLDFFSSWAPGWLTEAISSLGFLTHYMTIMRGQIALPDVMFFLSLIVGWLAACGVALEMKKAH